MIRTAIVRNTPANLDLGLMARDLIRPYVQAYDSWRSGMTSLLERADAKDSCCSRCAADDCSCSCCVADSDLLVEARLGERRVVPITIENHWRRDREIELELSSWTRTGDVQVEGHIVTPTSFTIEPCGQARVTLVIGIDTAKDSTTDKQTATAATTATTAAGRDRMLVDVTECKVAYADLRVKGCDIRPVRIAVAILPHHCDDHVIDCRCGCC